MPDAPVSVKGMNDILSPEVSKWHFLEEKARGVLESFAYREVRTPLLEYTSLFTRAVGEVTVEIRPDAIRLGPPAEGTAEQQMLGGQAEDLTVRGKASMGIAAQKAGQRALAQLAVPDFERLARDVQGAEQRLIWNSRHGRVRFS